MSNGSSLTMRGEHAHALPRANRVYEAGRVCAEEGCDTRLSMYNRSKLCWQHEPLRYDVLRGRKKKRPDYGELSDLSDFAA